MAQFAIHGTWKSVIALASLFAFIGLLTYALAGGVHQPENPGKDHPLPLFGLILYALTIVIIVLGFWSKEDVIAVAGIMALSGLVILDILLRVGVLGYNGVRVL
jgi:hypothetical protein